MRLPKIIAGLTYLSRGKIGNMEYYAVWYNYHLHVFIFFRIGFTHKFRAGRNADWLWYKLTATNTHTHKYTQTYTHTKTHTHTIGRPHSMPRTATYVQHAVKGSSHKFAVIKNGEWWSSCHRASQTLINLTVSPPSG